MNRKKLLTIKALGFAIMALGLGLIAPAYVEAFEIEIYKDFDPWFGEKRVEDVLRKDLGLVLDVDYGVRPTFQLVTDGIPADTQVVIITSNSLGDGTTLSNVNNPVAQANLAAFADGGGVLVMHLADNLFGNSFLAPGLGPADETLFTNDIDLLTTDHPLVHGPDGQAGTADDLTQTNIQWVSGCCAASGALPTLPSSATTIISARPSADPILADYPSGSGTVIVTTMPLEFGSTGDPGVGEGAGFGSPWRILLNEIAYAVRFAAPRHLTLALAERVESANLEEGVENKLVNKLDDALKQLDKGKVEDAIKKLNDFIEAVQKEVDKGTILFSEGETWISDAEQIISLLGGS